jgi:hypothetical protein
LPGEVGVDRKWIMTEEMPERNDPQGATLSVHNPLKRKTEKNRLETDLATDCFYKIKMVEETGVEPENDE